MFHRRIATLHDLVPVMRKTSSLQSKKKRDKNKKKDRSRSVRFDRTSSALDTYKYTIYVRSIPCNSNFYLPLAFSGVLQRTREPVSLR